MRRAVRVAVLVIGVVLVVLLLPLMSWFYEMGLAVGDESGAREVLVGVIMLVMWLIACGFVLFRPLVSAVVFVLAGILGFTTGGRFPIVDPWVEPTISIVLAGLSFLGRDRKKERRQFTITRTP
jgi:hypothetical protein